MFDLLGSPIRLAKSVVSIFKDKEAKGLLIFVIILMCIGSLFFSHAEHWSWFNSLYFSVTTLTTVGFGDFTPHTTAGRVFTIFYILFGVGIIFGLINIIAKHARKNYIRQTERHVEEIEERIVELIDKALERRIK